MRIHWGCVLFALVLGCTDGERVFSDALRERAADGPIPARARALEMDSSPRFPDAERVIIVQADWLRDAVAQLPRARSLPEPWPCPQPKLVSDVRALAAPDRTIVHCCGAYDSNDDWLDMKPPCSHFVAIDHGWARAEREEQRAQLFGPIRTEAQAVGRLALAQRSLLLEPGTFPNHDLGPAPTLVVPEATRVGADTQLEVPLWEGFGCTSPIVLVSYRISPSGALAEVGPRKTLLLPRPSWCLCDIPAD